MPKKVLVVDDAIFMRDRIREVLEPTGFEVVGEAANALVAIEKYQEYNPDFTIMDLTMPVNAGLDSIRATREITSARPDAVIIVIAEFGQESLVREAIEAGASDFLIKPYRPEDLLALLEKSR